MKLVITMSRRYGTGASLIAKELSEELGIPVYDKAYIEQFKLENHRRFRGMMVYDSHRVKKFLAVILGIIDYKRGRFGKCKWNIIQ